MGDDDAAALREQVRARYAAVAGTVAGTVASRVSVAGQGCCGPAAPASGEGSCCGEGATGEVFGAALYQPAERDGLPEAAVLASLGCGNPVAVAELRAGETVLDLGSGGGIDVLLSAARVGPTGRAIGLDMTEEMLALARANAERAGAANVEFVKGTIEDIPLPDASVDVVISNCVVNLSVDKPAVFAGLARVLRPGGRIGISDVVAADHLTAAQRAERGSHVGCIAGALSESEYQRELAAAGFTDIAVRFTHEVADGMHGAIIRAVRPGPASRRQPVT